MHRRKPTYRQKTWDYGWEASYFITIVTKKRRNYFGKIANSKVVLSAIGKIVKQEWLRTPIVRPRMNIVLDEFCIMPDHFHGILTIGNNNYNGIYRKESERIQQSGAHTFACQSDNLSSIIRGFKSSVTAQATKINPNFGWQRNFHDHVIKNYEYLHFIQSYISNNPRAYEQKYLNKNPILCSQSGVRDEQI